MDPMEGSRCMDPILGSIHPMHQGTDPEDGGVQHDVVDDIETEKDKQVVLQASRWRGWIWSCSLFGSNDEIYPSLVPRRSMQADWTRRGVHGRIRDTPTTIGSNGHDNASWNASDEGEKTDGHTWVMGLLGWTHSLSRGTICCSAREGHGIQLYRRARRCPSFIFP